MLLHVYTKDISLQIWHSYSELFLGIDEQAVSRSKTTNNKFFLKGITIKFILEFN